MKRTRTRFESRTITAVESSRKSSILTGSTDWVDDVVADAAINLPLQLDTNQPPAHHELNFGTSSTLPPQEFFNDMLKIRGYSAATRPTLTSGYKNEPTQHQLSSYGMPFTKAIRSSNADQVKLLLFESGLSPNASNKFGESVVHLACRRGDQVILQLLIKAGCTVQVSDDYGRTPLHDACWTSTPNFELVSMLLDKDPWLIMLNDCRGTTPLGYVKNTSHWKMWNQYLENVADKYWPRARFTSETSKGFLIDTTWSKSNFRRELTPSLALTLNNLEFIAKDLLNRHQEDTN